MRKEFTGGARKAVLSGAVDAVVTALACDDLTGWPTGAAFRFTATIDRDLASEEKVLCTSRSVNTLTVFQRGYDGTTGRAHAGGATIEHTLDSVVIDEANRLANLGSAIGSLLVWNGTAFVELAAGVTDDVLTIDTALPTKAYYASRLVPLLATAPAYKAGGQYYDTTLGALMVGQGGTWKPAARGVYVFANAAARNAVLTTAGPLGYLAYLDDEDRLYVGVGTAWEALPKPGEWFATYADATALAASTLAVGSVAKTADGRFWIKRTAGWKVSFAAVDVGASSGAAFPSSPMYGDLFFRPL